MLQVFFQMAEYEFPELTSSHGHTEITATVVQLWKQPKNWQGRISSQSESGGHIKWVEEVETWLGINPQQD